MTRHARHASFAAAILACFASVAVRAEVGVIGVVATGDARPPTPYVQYIVDDPEPVGYWRPVSDVRPDRRVLNAGGDDRGDGPPVLVVHPSSRLIFVVWSKSTAGGFDLVLSRFANGAWQAEEVVSAGPEDELDPQVTVGTDGKIHLTYWTRETADGDGVVRYRQAPANLGSWSLPQRVSFAGESARRPSIAVHQGRIKIGYEAWPAGSLEPASRDVVLASRELTANTWLPEWIATTAYTGALWTGLHSKGDELWIEWVDAENGPDAGEMGWRELAEDGSWTPVSLEPFDDEEQYEFHVRERIRRIALFGPIHPDGNDPPDLE